MKKRQLISIAGSFLFFILLQSYASIFSSSISNSITIERISFQDDCCLCQVKPNPNKLNLYLHVGPGKMATTTLQEALKEDKILLNMDGYCIFNPSILQHFLGHLLQSKPKEEIAKNAMWNELVSFLEHCYDLKQHVFLSSEFLGLISQQIWDDLLMPLFSHWNFHLVVGYRHWYSWFPSAHFQIFKMNIENRGWPGANSGVRVPALIEWYKHPHATRLYTDSYISHWKKIVQNNSLDVLVYNLHEDNNVMKTIYCKMLQDTRNTCKKYLNYSFPIKNVGFSLEYDRIAVALHDIKIIPDYISRKSAAEYLRTFFENELKMGVNDFPRDCVEGESLYEILNKSLNLQQRIFPEQRDEKFHEEFFKYASANLCSVNVNSTIHLFASALTSSFKAWNQTQKLA